MKMRMHLPLAAGWMAAMALVALGMAGLVGGGCADREDHVVLRLAHSLDTTHPVHHAMEFMAEELGRLSEGRVTLKIYPNSQLGSEREMIELVQLGAIDLVKTSTAPLEGFVPVMSLFGIPYLFRGPEHFWHVLDGPIGRRLLEASVDKQLRGLCYYDAGSRSFYTRNTPIHRPADLHGLKIRVQSSRTAIQMVESMGGSPTPISFGELYSALEQGVVDGAENNPPSLLTSRHYEVCRHYSLDEHTRVPDIVLISTERWRRLSPEVRGWLRRAAAASSRFQRKLWQQKTADALETIARDGVEIIHPDKETFRQAVRAMYDAYFGTEIGTLIDEIQAID